MPQAVITINDLADTMLLRTFMDLRQYNRFVAQMRIEHPRIFTGRSREAADQAAELTREEQLARYYFVMPGEVGTSHPDDRKHGLDQWDEFP